MIIGSISENKNKEKRISITPEIIKKYIGLNFEVQISEGYGAHLGLDDNLFKDAGAVLNSNNEDIIKKSNILVQVELVDEKYFYFVEIIICCIKIKI